MALFCPSKSYLINLFISMWMCERAGRRPAAAQRVAWFVLDRWPSRLVADAALAESPPTMALKTIMQMQDLSRRLSQEGERARARGIGGARAWKGGELHCGRQADCVSAGEKDEKGCLSLCIPALFEDVFLNGCGWFLAILPWLAEHGDKVTSDMPDERRWDIIGTIITADRWVSQSCWE